MDIRKGQGSFPSTCPTANAALSTEVGLQASEINPLRSILKKQTYDRSPSQSTRSLGSGEGSPPAFPPDGAKTRAAVKKAIESILPKHVVYPTLRKSHWFSLPPYSRLLCVEWEL